MPEKTDREKERKKVKWAGKENESLSIQHALYAQFSAQHTFKIISLDDEYCWATGKKKKAKLNFEMVSLTGTKMVSFAMTPSKGKIAWATLQNVCDSTQSIL